MGFFFCFLFFYSCSWKLVKDEFIYVFPCRWEVIANYMNIHSTSGTKRNAKDVINKAKNLQRLGELRLNKV